MPFTVSVSAFIVFNILFSSRNRRVDMSYLSGRCTLWNTLSSRSTKWMGKRKRVEWSAWTWTYTIQSRTSPVCLYILYMVLYVRLEHGCLKSYITDCSGTHRTHKMMEKRGRESHSLTANRSNKKNDHQRRKPERKTFSNFRPKNITHLYGNEHLPLSNLVHLAGERI